MRVSVLLFAAAREAAGAGALTLELDDGATVGDAFVRLGEVHADLTSVLPNCRAAVDEEFARPDAPLRDGATLAILPPVSGG